MKPTRHNCVHVSGNGAERYFCTKTNTVCLCQTWCTAERRYIPRNCAQDCKQYEQKKENK